MTPLLSRFTLTAHVAVSVGWLGAVVAYLVLAVAALISTDQQLVRGAYLSMRLLGWFAIIPLSIAALLSGLSQSLLTRWGLLRHWWVVVKLLLTVAGTIVLLEHIDVVSRVANLAAQAVWSSADVRFLGIQLVVHAAGGLILLIVVTILSVYKPWGMTPYGRRNAQQDITPHSDSHAGRSSVGWRWSESTPRWVYIVGFHAIGLVALLVVLHLTGGGVRIH